MSDSLRPHESQHARPPCPSQTPGVYSNSCPSSWWCHPAISSSVVPFSSCPQSLPASGSFPTSQLFAWGGQSTGVSALASVFPMNTQDWSPLGWTGWISLQSIVPLLGIKARALASRARSLSHWTTREVPSTSSFYQKVFIKYLIVKGFFSCLLQREKLNHNIERVSQIY